MLWQLNLHQLWLHFFLVQAQKLDLFPSVALNSPRPHHLNFLWTPYKLILIVVVHIGKLDELPALFLIPDSKQKVAENTFLDIWEFSINESLLQEEADQRGLVVSVPQGPLALQDAGDAQVVMSASVKVMESVSPVWRSHDFPCCLITQLDAIEVQHELVGLQ